MGMTERHWFEDEEPELTENQLEDILWENNKIFERGYQKGFSDGKSALLREQEPRVMTLEEVKTMKRLTICAVEQRSKIIKNIFNAEYSGIVTLGNENFLDFGLYGDTNRYRRAEARYGKSWRCWTARPTNAQSEAVEWEC